MTNPSRFLVMILSASLLLTGCPNPNIYGTPRTVKPGKVSHTVSAEYIGWVFELREPAYDEFGEPTGEYTSTTTSGGLPLLPTYGLRLGVAEQVDVGFRLSSFTSLGTDVKYNFVRSDIVDLAIDPGLQWMNSNFNVFHIHVPLLVGLNLSERVTLVGTPGIMYGISTHDSEDSVSEAFRQLLSADGLYARAGLGLNVRITPHFAIHPEMTFLRSLEDRDSTFGVSAATSYMFGIGFNIANLPDYGLGE